MTNIAWFNLSISPGNVEKFNYNCRNFLDTVLFSLELSFPAFLQLLSRRLITSLDNNLRRRQHMVWKREHLLKCHSLRQHCIIVEFPTEKSSLVVAILAHRRVYKYPLEKLHLINLLEIKRWLQKIYALERLCMLFLTLLK